MCNNNVDKLVKSHIIPEAFFRAIKNGNDHLLVVSNVKNEFTKKSWIGIYDQEILCQQCESKFQAFDDYGQDILLKNLSSFKPIIDKGKNEIVGWIIDKEIDFELIIKFFLSVLYRASLSDRKFFEHISLGPYQEKLKAIIELREKIGIELDVLLKRFDISKSSIASSILDPRPTRIDNVKFYQIYLGSGYVAYIKVDKQRIPTELEKITIGKLSRLHIISGNFEESREMDIARRIGEKLKKENDSKIV